MSKFKHSTISLENKMGYFYDEGLDEPRYFNIIWVSIAAVVALCFGIWGITVALAGPIGAGEQHKQTNSADYRIAAYDKFHDDCNAIAAQQQVIANLQDTLDNDKAAGVDSTQLTVDAHNITAAKNVYFGMVGEYNSDASKSGTKAQWLASNLPQHISNDVEETVSCG
jgi:hypothetical protein